MQIKFKRYTGTKGLISKSTSYNLEAVMLPSSEERQLLDQANRWSKSVWALSDENQVDLDDEVYAQLSHLQIGSLLQGVKFEFSHFTDVQRTEADIVEASQRLLRTAEELATFDGRERVFDVQADGYEMLTVG